MFYFIVGILFSVGIFIAFKAFAVLKIDTFQAIVTNYFFCILTGLLFIGDFTPLTTISWQAPWVYTGLFLGVLFIGTFYLMAITAQRVSVAAASMATKISLIIPVTISLWWLQGNADRTFDGWNYLGLSLVFVAIVFASFRPSDTTTTKKLVGWQAIVLPFIVFAASGTIDTLLNVVNVALGQYAESTTLQAFFPILIFSVAFIIGVLILLIRRPAIQRKSIVGGALLGICNYFSVYYVLKALDVFENNGAFVYPNFNIGIIVLSALAAKFIFQEKLLAINRWGIALSVVAIFLLSYRAIFAYFQ
ncbi:MAG: hypothetical protein ACFB0B_19195 [Thermonemataceae bacterium]